MKLLSYGLSLLILWGVMNASAYAEEFHLTDYLQTVPRYVFVGEIHGTRESPEIFLDIVKDISRQSCPCIIALEIPRAEEEAINRFISSDDFQRQDALTQMLSGNFWNAPPTAYDGRASLAMLNLLKGLRQIKTNSPQIQLEIIGFQSVTDREATAYIQSPLAKHENAHLISYSGNVHAAKKPIPINQDRPPMPHFFPENETYAISIEAERGEAWGCVYGGSCGVYTLGANLQAPRRNAGFLVQEKHRRFDAIYVVPNVTASPQAATSPEVQSKT